MTTPARTYQLFVGLYLVSFAVLAGWFVLLLVGLARPDIMALANRVALPVLMPSVICLVLFRRLARRAKGQLA
jgi:hypothetical protein